MTEGKFKRLIVAATVGGVMLLVFLLSVLVFQLVKISVETKREAELNSEIAKMDDLIREGKEDMEILSQRWYIERLAREYGYFYVGDDLLKK